MKIRYYIFFYFFKYLIVFISLFLGLIWLSQILRILDIKFSISNQLMDIIVTTFLVLPSFINPIIPIILLITYIYLNYNLSSGNEMLIINQYLNLNIKRQTLLILNILIIFFYTLNNEYLSKQTYKYYKTKEVDIRNNLKLGVPYNQEFHIDNLLSIFFKNFENKTFYEVESILYNENQFIKSKVATVEYDNKGFNISFIDGFRITMNDKEKSKTVFKKFDYGIQNNDIEKLEYDKAHFNTFDLLKMKEGEFYYFGHNRIFQYIFLIYLLFKSRIILFRNGKVSKGVNNFTLILAIVLIYIINSYLFSELINGSINLITYYLLNIIPLLVLNLYLDCFYDTQ